MVIDNIIEKIAATVENHYLGNGAYARFLWQDENDTRKMGVNEYGCADAANILYSIGCFESDASKRAQLIRTMQDMQDEETGLFFEGTHHTYHTTAHVVSALELFDAKPVYELKALKKYLDIDELYSLLEGLDWENNPWPQSHQGAGVFAAMTITKMAPIEWQNSYFSWLKERCSPVYGMSYGAKMGKAPLYEHLNGWFHYIFNHEAAHRPIPYPDKLIDSCLDMYYHGGLDDKFANRCGFCEIDWIFCINRASRQTAHRFDEVKEAIRDFGRRFVGYMDQVDQKTDDGFNDLHMLFGAVCALCELQSALPGEYLTTVPLKLVLDRRPFI